MRQVPGSADQGYYAATERREALPCASVSRRSGKQAAAVTKVRLSAFRLPLLSKRARFPEPPIHAKGFAGSDDACPEEGAMFADTKQNRHRPAPVLDLIGDDRATQYSRALMRCNAQTSALEYWITRVRG